MSDKLKKAIDFLEAHVQADDIQSKFADNKPEREFLSAHLSGKVQGDLVEIPLTNNRILKLEVVEPGLYSGWIQDAISNDILGEIDKQTFDQVLGNIINRDPALNVEREAKVEESPQEMTVDGTPKNVVININISKAIDEFIDLCKAKYIKREGSSGNYKYTYAKINENEHGKKVNPVKKQIIDKLIQHANDRKFYESIGNIKRASVSFDALHDLASSVATELEGRGFNFFEARDSLLDHANSKASGKKLMGLGGGDYIKRSVNELPEKIGKVMNNKSFDEYIDLLKANSSPTIGFTSAIDPETTKEEKKIEDDQKKEGGEEEPKKQADGSEVDENEKEEKSKKGNKMKSKKSFEEELDLLKGGEGSKGGKVIGHTKSGKPVYEKHEALHQNYSSFSAKDHDDASEIHSKEQKNKMKNQYPEPGAIGHSERKNSHKIQAHSIRNPIKNKSHQEESDMKKSDVKDIVKEIWDSFPEHINSLENLKKAASILRSYKEDEKKSGWATKVLQKKYGKAKKAEKSLFTLVDSDLNKAVDDLEDGSVAILEWDDFDNYDSEVGEIIKSNLKLSMRGLEELKKSKKEE